MTTAPFGESVPVQTLADGRPIPTLTLGVWQIPDGPQCLNAVKWALELEYRHIDTAQAYGNETSVGQALAESGLSRCVDVPVSELERPLNGVQTLRTIGNLQNTE